MCSTNVVFAGNAIDIMLTDDQDDNSSLFVDVVLLLVIKLYPSDADLPTHSCTHLLSYLLIISRSWHWQYVLR